MTAVFVLDMQDRRYPDVRRRFLDTLGAELAAGKREVLITEPKRSNEQNALLWAVLHDLAEQVGFKPARWRGNTCLEDGGYVLLSDVPTAKRITAEQFKDLLTAALRRPRMFAGIDGGVVAVGMSTSRMTKREMSALIDSAFAWGADLGVQFSDPRPTHPED
jgi:hypothetical protein